MPYSDWAAHKVLEMANDLLAGEDGQYRVWCKHSEAINDIGNRCDAFNVRAVRWDLSGAIKHELEEYSLDNELSEEDKLSLNSLCHAILQAAIPQKPYGKKGDPKPQIIADYNDDRDTHRSDIRTLMRQAISVAASAGRKAETKKVASTAQQGMDL